MNIQSAISNPIIFFPSISLEDWERREFKRENQKFKILKEHHRKKCKNDVIRYNTSIAIPKIIF